MDGQGRVVGVNAAIISPSGASAGIGFAIGMDAGIRGLIDGLVEEDLEKVVRVRGRKRGWLGASLAEKEGSVEALWKKMNVTRGDVGAGDTSDTGGRIFVMEVKDGSPAQQADINLLQYLDGSGRIQIGDRIVAIGGNIVKDSIELTKDLKSQVAGEKISIHVENRFGDRRIIYVTLKDKDDNSKIKFCIILTIIK